MSQLQYNKHIEQLLRHRGPNGSNTLFENQIFFASTILWHQGNSMTTQPIKINSNNVLLFNGDLFMDEIIEESDTSYLIDQFSNVKNDNDLIQIFKNITGPFSVIFSFNNSLYFIRDSLGRNSLIIGKSQNSIFLTSVIDVDDENIQAMEVPPLGLYKICVSNLTVELYPFQEISHDHHLEQLKDIQTITNVVLMDTYIQPDWQLLKPPYWNFSFDKLDLGEVNTETLFDYLLSLTTIDQLCDTFLNLLAKSVEDRIVKTQKECKNCLEKSKKACNHSHVAVLFSGGVDCTLLTALAHKFVNNEKPIDLLNVAFEKVTNKNSNKIDFSVPDRLTGIETLNELRTIYPEREWNFVEINIARSELYEHTRKLSSLIYPLKNVLDESLGIAIYFASRGIGIVKDEQYESPCRVILMGSGADELFGGYSRHRSAYQRSTNGNDILTQELELDWVRLPSRNLARDDRVVADNGVTVRAPYVEEKFVNFARNLTSLQKCYHALPEGIGDKLLLRLSAYKLGLKNCCQFRKRALQFGSRIADKRQNAAEKSKLLQKR